MQRSEAATRAHQLCVRVPRSDYDVVFLPEAVGDGIVDHDGVRARPYEACKHEYFIVFARRLASRHIILPCRLLNAVRKVLSSSVHARFGIPRLVDGQVDDSLILKVLRHVVLITCSWNHKVTPVLEVLQHELGALSEVFTVLHFLRSEIFLHNVLESFDVLAHQHVTLVAVPGAHIVYFFEGPVEQSLMAHVDHARRRNVPVKNRPKQDRQTTVRISVVLDTCRSQVELQRLDRELVRDLLELVLLVETIEEDLVIHVVVADVAFFVTEAHLPHLLEVRQVEVLVVLEHLRLNLVRKDAVCVAELALQYEATLELLLEAASSAQIMHNFLASRLLVHLLFDICHY